MAADIHTALAFLGSRCFWYQFASHRRAGSGMSACLGLEVLSRYSRAWFWKAAMVL